MTHQSKLFFILMKSKPIINCLQVIGGDESDRMINHLY